jgi:hypothetical protein
MASIRGLNGHLLATTRIAAMLFGVSGLVAGAASAAHTSFRPGQLWLDTDGSPIQAHGGGVMHHQGTYYWSGTEYAADSSGTFRGTRCYSSTDLYNWTYEGYALEVNESIPELSSTIVNERAHVVCNAATAEFVMWWHMDDWSGATPYVGARAGVAVSDTATGLFQYRRCFRPINDQTYRDDNLFLDDDGTAYVFYASEDNWTEYVSRLSADFLDVETPIVENATWARNQVNGNREAPAPFKHDGRYYLITSGCTGWSPNPADCAISSTGPLGPYVPQGNPCVGPGSDTTFDSQSTCVFPVAGKLPGSFIFMADRWNSGNVNDSRYVWLPLVMESDGTFQLQWLDEWDLSVFGSSVPVIALDPGSLSFSATAGGPDLTPQNVSVTNSGTDTLADVTISTDYGSGSSWLSVSRSGSGNSQTLANSVDISGLAAGTYPATVSVHSSGASNSPQTYTVTLVVNTEPEESLLGHWRFDDGAGTGALDSAGNGKDGTLNNMDPATDWVTGIMGQALDFDGTNDYVSVPPLNLDSNTATITAWVKGQQTANATGIVFSRAGSTVAGLAVGDGKLMYTWNDVGWSWDSGLAIPANEWAFVAMTVEPTKVTLYVNESSAVHTHAHALEAFDGETCIGRDPQDGNRYWLGAIDDVRLYGRALTQSEIEAVDGLASSVPALSLDPTSLSFSATTGAPDRSTQNVSVANAGGGTLADVAASVAYDSDSGWLAVACSGTGNSQTLANSVDASGLALGTYTATVSVSASGATNSPQTYSVTLTVAAPAPPTITSAAPTTATVGVLYVYTITVTGSPVPAYSVSGSPAWLQLWGNVLSGTPTAAGMTGTITVSVENTQGADTQQSAIDVAAAGLDAGISSVSCGFWRGGGASGMTAVMAVCLSGICLVRRRARQADAPRASRSQCDSRPRRVCRLPGR